MDVFAALALSTEPPLQNVIKGKAMNSDDSLLSKAVWRQIIGVSTWDTVIMIVLMLGGKTMGDLDYEFYAPTGRVSPGPFDSSDYSDYGDDKAQKIAW